MKTKIYFAFFTSLFYLNTVFAGPADTAYYSIILGSSIAGSQQVVNTAPAKYTIRFSYNDRGRGPDITTLIQGNSKGLITSLETKGVDYFKNPYSEKFSVRADSATWIINGAETKGSFANKFYYSITNDDVVAPCVDGWLIKWLQLKPGKQAGIFPSGSAKAKVLQSRKIQFSGKKTGIKLYGIYRDTLPQPELVWLTDKGEFFAKIYGWLSIVPRGYEAWADTLLALQEKEEEKYYQHQEKQCAAALPRQMKITNVNVFDSETATVKNNMTVVIENGKIKEMHLSAGKPEIEMDINTIDGTGKFLMPGLWDMHCHYGLESGLWYVAGGVTHVRDMGNIKSVVNWKRELAANEILGPDISYLSGFIDQKGPYQAGSGTIVASLSEAIRAIREYHRLGYQQIKIYSSIDTGWVRPMSEEAKRLGMRVCGHVPAFMQATNAIDDGYNELTHINFVFLNFMDPHIDTRTPLRIRAVAEHAGELNVDCAEVTAFIAKMKKNHIALDPTLNIFSGQFNNFKGDTLGYMKPVASWVPTSKKSSLVLNAPFGNAEQAPRYRRSFANMLKMLKRMYDEGIRIVPGTDGGVALALQNELKIYTDAGIPAAQVLKIATWNAAADCGLLDRYGKIEIGRDADLLLIDGNPVKDINDVRRIRLVIKNNRMYSPKQLLASQGWKYFY